MEGSIIHKTDSQSTVTSPSSKHDLEKDNIDVLAKYGRCALLVGMMWRGLYFPISVFYSSYNSANDLFCLFWTIKS